MSATPQLGRETSSEQPTPGANGQSAGERAVSPSILRALAAFERERAALFATDPFRWVAYRDGRRLRTADTQTELYRHCLGELGLAHDEFIVRCITPEDPTEVEDTRR